MKIGINIEIQIMNKELLRLQLLILTIYARSGLYIIYQRSNE